MKTSAFISAVFCVISISITPSFSQDKIAKRIDSVMQIANSRGIFNGNILVAKSNKILYQASFGYADGTTKAKLNSRLIFDVGSVSKEFNGVGIMLLKERKMLSLDDPISQFIPELPSWAKRVKVRHLINYTSGIPMLDTRGEENDSAMWAALKHLDSLKFEPGTAYIYNHYNVFLQMRIIEKVSGMTYADFITKNLLIPCKMTTAVVDYPTEGRLIAKAFDNDFQPTPYAQGMSGWVRLSAEDLYKWTDALDHYRLISKESYRELAANFPGGESSLGTTGFEKDTLMWHQHQGSNSNFEALLYSLPQDSLVIILMTNNQQMKVHGIRAAILNVLNNQAVSVPKKSVYLQVRDKMLSDVGKGIAYYQMLKADMQDSYDFSFEIGDLISSGKYLQRRKLYDNAIRIFTMAVQLPAKPADISYGYELIAECYMSKAEKTQSLAFYKKAVETDPNNKNAQGMIATLTNLK